MRLKHLIHSEFRFLFKYGIIPLYCIFTVLYLCLLAVIPESARKITATALVFTDPAAMGLFFMGAVVLFEKSQRVESSLGVSPIKISEYIVAKVLPIMVVGMIVSLILCLFAGIYDVAYVVIGVAFSSILFSLCALIVGSNIATLNSFMIATIPVEVLISLPALLFLFGVLRSHFWILHPGIAAIQLISSEGELWYLSVASLIAWIIPAYIVCKKSVAKSFSTMGGAKL